MGDRITLSMIDGTLQVINNMSGLTFERHGNNVFNTSNGGYSKYAYGTTKSVLYGKLQTVVEHLYSMLRLEQWLEDI